MEVSRTDRQLEAPYAFHYAMPHKRNWDVLTSSPEEAARLITRNDNACPYDRCRYVPADERSCFDCWLEFFVERYEKGD